MARFVISAAVATAAFVASGYNPVVAAQAFSITSGEAPSFSPTAGNAVAGIPATKPAAGNPVTETA